MERHRQCEQISIGKLAWWATRGEGRGEMKAWQVEEEEEPLRSRPSASSRDSRDRSNKVDQGSPFQLLCFEMYLAYRGLNIQSRLPKKLSPANYSPAPEIVT